MHRKKGFKLKLIKSVYVVCRNPFFQVIYLFRLFDFIRFKSEAERDEEEE